MSVATCRGCGTDHAPGSAACPLSRVGKTIASRYRLDHLLGFGGMGAVYAAENLQLGRRVAIKVLHPAMAARSDIVDRFRREARSVANLKHPGFAQVFALDADEAGQFFIEMELLEGEPIDRMIRSGMIPIGRCIAILESALDALAVAHDAGLVHRDLKPENLFACVDPRLGEYVKVLDFGIARGADDLRLTTGGQFMGTITYASPEQLRDTASVDARSDVYSFGATAFEILTRTSVAGGGSYADVVTRIMTQDVERSIAAKRPDAPGWLDALVARALAHDPAQRFANAGEMLRVLRSHKHDRLPTGPQALAATQVPGMVVSHPAPSVARARSKLPWLLGGIGLAGVAAIAIVLARSSNEARIAVVVDAAVDSPADSPIVDAMTDAAMPDAAMPADATVVDAARVDAAPRPTKTADEYNEAGKELMFASNYAGAEAQFRNAIRIAPSAKLYFNLCVSQYQQGHFGEAQRSCKGALARDPEALLREKTLSTLERIERELANLAR